MEKNPVIIVTKAIESKAFVTVKKAARFPANVLELPEPLNNEFTQVGKKCQVFYSENKDTFSIIYEFTKNQ